MPYDKRPNRLDDGDFAYVGNGLYIRVPYTGYWYFITNGNSGSWVYAGENPNVRPRPVAGDTQAGNLLGAAGNAWDMPNGLFGAVSTVLFGEPKDPKKGTSAFETFLTFLKWAIIIAMVGWFLKQILGHKKLESYTANRALSYAPHWSEVRRS